MNPVAAFISTCLLTLATLGVAHANEVKILAANFHDNGDNHWSVDVTLKHDDTDWKHYADEWRLVDEKGKVIADRVLFHPHLEQPFTRGLSNIRIPEGVRIIFIEAHDKVHGWSPHRLKVDMSAARHGELKVEAKVDR